MRATLRSLVSVVRDELGRDSSRYDASGGTEALINEAGERWVNAHGWAYLRSKTLELELEPGVESYRMSGGVRAVNAIHRKASIWPDIPVVSYEAFTSARDRYLASVERQYRPLATTVYDIEDGDEERTLYLHVFPALNAAETVSINVESGWLPLNHLDDVADVPPPLVPHFIEWVRVYAVHREQPEAASIYAYMQTPAFREAKRVDAQASGRPVLRNGRVDGYYNAARYGTLRARYDALRTYYEGGYGS